MYFRLLTTGVLPAWYTLSFPVTFILEPGLLVDPEVDARWKATGPKDETDEQLCLRVEKTLINFYTKRGFTLIATSRSSGNHGLPTMARIVKAGDYFRGPNDTLTVAKVPNIDNLPEFKPPASTRGSSSPSSTPAKSSGDDD